MNAASAITQSSCLRVLRWYAIALLAATAFGATPRDAHSGCNLIPPPQITYPSTLGGVASPITIPGGTVELRLTPCDASLGFDATPGLNSVTLTFTPPAGAPTVVPITSGVTVDNCNGSDCGILRFAVPDTTALLPADGLAGPAAITVTRGATIVASIGPLFEPRPNATDCIDEAEPVFEQLTVLPTPNDFADLSSGAATRVLATLDGGGNLIIPFDYVAVLPLGPGAPVARLVSGFATIDAFSANPGVPIVIPDSSFARSFTVDGRPLPPLLRANAAGTAVFGTTDAAQAILRIARTDAHGGPALYDLTDRLSNGGRGPIVITNFGTSSNEPIPLANLHSTAAGIAYTRDESLEGNLNAASGDTDTDDRVVQILDAATGAGVSTGMAASDPHSPIVGDAAVTTGGETVAFLESESHQNRTDVNGDGDPLDSILRVFDLTGAQITPDGTLVASLGSAVNRAPIAISGPLVFYREPQPGISFVETGGNEGQVVDSIATSPDGRVAHLTVPVLTPGISVLAGGRLDPETGHLSTVSLQSNFIGYGGMAGATGLAFSPDSRFLYVAGTDVNSVLALNVGLRLDQGITVVPVDTETDGAAGVDGLAGVTRVAVSPDGAHLYAAGTAEDAVAVFARNVATGTLTFVQTQFEGVSGVADLDEPRGLALSPDGQNLYVTARASSAVVAFTRDSGTGALTFLASYVDGGLGGPALGGAREVVVSADGLNVYVAAQSDSAVSVFGRNTVSGALTFVEAKVDGVGGVSGLAQARALAIAPDAQTLYAGGDADASLAAFNRVVPGGTLSFVESETSDSGAGAVGVGRTRGLAVAADGDHMYAALDFPAAPLGGISTVSTWRHNARLLAFDTDTTTLRPGLGTVPTSVAAVAAGRAVFLSPEGNASGTDRSGDGDTDDVLAYVYDAASDSVTQLTGISAYRADHIALSAQVLALSIRESAQPGQPDLNGNGLQDEALGVVPTNALATPPTIVPGAVVAVADGYGGLAATDLCAGGTSDRESCTTDGDCPGGTCKGVVVFPANGPLGLYWLATGQLQFLGDDAGDFLVSGNLVAMRVAESVGQDFNGDGDTSDTVLFVYDLKFDRLINSGQAVVRCELPGCTPGLQYKFVGTSVAFLTEESAQGNQDLDGDGFANGTVAQVFNPRTARRQVFNVRAGAPNLPPLPDDLFGETVLYQEFNESDLGIDVNMDGDMDDVVNLITGDNDGDGIFNENDTCVEGSDAGAIDTDGDGLGDVCDAHPYCNQITPLSPPLAPVASAKCQKTLGKGTRTYLAARATAIRGCLNDLAKGKLSGTATTLCRGTASLPPSDPKTADKLTKARTKLDNTIASGCSPEDLTMLDSCATSVAGVQACLADRIVTGVETMLDFAYGDLAAAITDKAVLKCQQAIGNATLGYLKSASSAIVKCLDQRNDGTISGDGQALCFGASTLTGITSPSDPKTGAKLTKAGANIEKALDTKCQGSVLSSLHACGTTRDVVSDCLTCGGWQHVVDAIRGAYGVP